jgi:serine phosphatase RsbU (regulator of sigma subunit)
MSANAAVPFTGNSNVIEPSSSRWVRGVINRARVVDAPCAVSPPHPTVSSPAPLPVRGRGALLRRGVLVARDVQPFIEALAGLVRGAVLVDAAGELIWQGGNHEEATMEVPVLCGEYRATLLVPPQFAVFGRLAAAALERLGAARAAIDDLALNTRRLWWEQNLLFSVGELLRHGFKDRDITRWLVDRLAVMEPQETVVLTWDGNDLEVVEGRLPKGLKIGDRIAATSIASEVLERAEPIARTAPFEGPAGNELRVELEPGQHSLLVPLHSAERVLGLVMLLRRPEQRAFSAEEVKLAQLLSDLASVALTNRQLLEEAEHSARVMRELELAAEIHQELFPTPLARYGSLQVAARCETVNRVGGDAFLQRRLRNGKVAIGVLDVTGHGIGVSLALSALFSRLDALADAVETPAELLTIVNEQLTQGEFNRFTMATAVIAFVDPENGRFTLSSAAHPRALIRRADGNMEMLVKSGLPLGVRSGDEYPLDEGQLEAGDLLVLYSDGISEAIGRGAVPFGVEGLWRSLGRDFSSAEEAVAAVNCEVVDFSGGESPIDDRTVVVVRRTEECHA